MVSILSIGEDERLRCSRHLLLLTTGADVVSVEPQAGLQQLRKNYFDLVILCHTLLQQDARDAAALLKLFWPKTSLIYMTFAAGYSNLDYACFRAFPSLLGPKALVDTIAQLVPAVRPPVADRVTPSNRSGKTRSKAGLRLQPSEVSSPGPTHNQNEMNG